MQVLNSRNARRGLVSTRRMPEASVRFVPTMGAPREDPLSLVRLTLQRADLVSVLIFVNSLQFNDQHDFRRYPVDHDHSMLLAIGVDSVLTPLVEDWYYSRSQTIVEDNRLSSSS